VEPERRGTRRRRRVFCASLADIFEGPETMPEDYTGTQYTNLLPLLGNEQVAAARNRLFRLIDDTPWLDWLLLTKRPQHVMPLYGNWLHWTRSAEGKPVAFPPNVWMGVSVEDQERAEERLPVLCSIPAKVRWISLEPMLGFIDLRPWLGGDDGVHWVVIGGESGPGHRPLEIDWVSRTVDMCREAGVNVFVKQDSGSKPGKQGRIPLDVWQNKEFPAASRTT
jgi:protein gp37